MINDIKCILKNRYLHIIGFSILFMFLGSFIPKLYFAFVDTREYYKFTEIRILTPVVQRCGTVDIELDRIALFDMEITRTADLIFVNSANEQVYHYPDLTDYVGEGSVTLESSRTIPCDLEHAGTYKFKFFVKYEVFGNNRIYKAESPTFQVVD